VTYETELEVENQDLSLRPGMTATADIRVAESKGVLLVPNAALRFNPEAASTSAAQPKKSFVQSLMPGPPRKAAKVKTAPTEEPKKAPGKARSGFSARVNPVAMTVKLGLTDGRMTEVSGEGLSEGLPIILRTTGTDKP